MSTGRKTRSFGHVARTPKLHVLRSLVDQSINHRALSNEYCGDKDRKRLGKKTEETEDDSEETV